MTSIWLRESEAAGAGPLCRDIEVDCAVVGGGIAGVTTALLLRREGLEVALLEQGEIAGETTGKNTGKVTCQHGLRYSRLRPETARLYYEANAAALALVRELSRSAPCGFEAIGTWVYAERAAELPALDREQQACEELGIPWERTDNALCMPDQGRFDPRRYAVGLAKLAMREGCLVHEHTRIAGLDGAGPYVLYAENGCRVRAERVALCTHYPLAGHSFFARLEPVRSYIVAAPVPEPLRAAYINAGLPVRSVNALPGGMMGLFGGENHRVGQGQRDAYAHLLDFARFRYGAGAPVCQWSAQDYATPDGLPYIGRLGRSEIYVATGFNKWGNTLGTAAGQLIRDLVTGRESRWAKLFSPSRISDALTPAFLHNGYNTAAAFAASHLRRGHRSMVLGRDCAGVLRVGAKQFGVYRDGEGRIHSLPLTCPHMKCSLRFNPLERTWDCPCHGSRFDYTGRLLEGPSRHPLPEAELPAKATPGAAGGGSRGDA